MDNENNLSGCLAYTAVLIVGAIISAIIILVFNIRVPIVIPALIIVAIIGWLELRKRRRDMESHLGRKIKGNHELVSLSSWMETPEKKEGSNQKVQTKNNNQRVPSPVVTTSTENRNPTNNPIIRPEKNEDEKLTEKPLGTPIKNFDRQTQIQMRENLASLLETARTKGKDALKEEVGKIMRSKGEDYDNLTIDQSLESGNPLEPRIYHYLFAHKYLPDKLLENSQGVMSWITGEKGVEHLITRWGMLRLFNNIDSKDYVSPTGLNRIVINPTSGHTIVLIQFPKPERVSEAFFSAILVQPDNSYRYFTLEKTFGEDDNGIPKTVLGEWINGNHVNLGSGSSPNIEDFSALIIERFI